MSVEPASSVEVRLDPFTSLEAYDTWSQHRPDPELCDVVDGQPVVTPSPGGAHQLVVTKLVVALSPGCPSGYAVVVGPWDWVLWQSPRLQIRVPDLMVVRSDATKARRLTEPPLLAVEVVSPTSFERDAITKRDEYARAGLDHYWLVDPTAPQIVVFRRTAHQLDVVAQAAGDSDLVITDPVAVTLRPSAFQE